MPLLMGAMVLTLTGCPDEMEPVGIVETEYEYLTQLRMLHLEAMESSREVSGITRRVELRDLAGDLLRPEVESRPEVEAMAQEIVDEWGEEIQRLQTPLREWRGIVIPEGP